MPVPPALRPLPPRPSLEFERKEAKALLRRLRAGDPEALERARARHPRIDASDPARIPLAEAQLVIAREYGFTSWPRLVQYFRDVERQRRGYQKVHTDRRDYYDERVRGMLDAHRDRRMWAGRALAAYVPRFYGMQVDDVFAASVTEDDTRLAVARRHGFPSWEVLLESAAEVIRHRPGEWDVDPIQHARTAMEAGDLDELRRVVEAHPDLLHPSDEDRTTGHTLIAAGVGAERVRGQEAMRSIMEWLVAQGFDVQLELNRQLCGRIGMKTETVQWLLDRGADPNWVAPNGIPVLEHALIRYWNGEAVDLVAARTVPRKALWIAAGLGDVEGVSRFLDRQGKPTAAARRLRPDFDAVHSPGTASHPDPDDEELLMEALYIAMLNGRTPVLEYMVSRGFPVNSLAYGWPVVGLAAERAMVSAVEFLVHAGADLDLRGWGADMSAREVARWYFEGAPQDAKRRRIVELCRMDPEAILAERDARPVKPPSMEPRLREALELAGDDAFRLGQSDIRPENLLFGLLRSGKVPLHYFTKVSRIDFERFRADVWNRVHPPEDHSERPKLPMHPDAQAAIEAAIAIATERRRETVGGHHLLYALMRSGQGPAAELLARYGSSAAALNAELERAL